MTCVAYGLCPLLPARKSNRVISDLADEARRSTGGAGGGGPPAAADGGHVSFAGPAAPSDGPPADGIEAALAALIVVTVAPGATIDEHDARTPEFPLCAQRHGGGGGEAGHHHHDAPLSARLDCTALRDWAVASARDRGMLVDVPHEAVEDVNFGQHNHRHGGHTGQCHVLFFFCVF